MKNLGRSIKNEFHVLSSSIINLVIKAKKLHSPVEKVMDGNFRKNLRKQR